MDTIKLYVDKGCDCDWQEIPNMVKGSGVKGYTKVGEICQACKDLAVITKISEDARKKEQDRTILIAEKQRELAIEELIKEGKLDSKGDLV